MKKLTGILCFVVIATSLSSCSAINSITRDNYYDGFWEREKLSSNLYLNSQKAKDMLDVDIAECITITENRYEIETNTLNTRKCDKKDGHDWNAKDDGDFFSRCMKRRGWINTKCCSFKK